MTPRTWLLISLVAGLLALLLLLVDEAGAQGVVGPAVPATPPPPTIIYLEPPVAVWTGEALYELEGLRPLYPARRICAASPCAVPVGAVVSTDGEHGVVVEARPYTLALPSVSR